MNTDPRRTIVTCHSNSARGRRWYRVAEVCEFNGVLYLHRDFVIDDADHHPLNARGNPRSLVDAIKLAKQHADRTGFPYLKGVHVGFFDRPLVKLDR